MENENAVMIRQENAVTEYHPLSLEAVKKQVNLIQEIMRNVMQDGTHYGKIPGCGDKPALLKAGAEKLAMTFRFAPRFETAITEMRDGHRDYRTITKICDVVSGVFLGQGVGSCSTMESKYRYRKAEQVCPECGQETIIKGKKEYGGGWLCYSKKGGCGAKFDDNDERINNQNMGRVEHDNPADYYNTCDKMSKKRSFIDATLTITGCSDIFTQDIDDSPELYGGKTPVEQKTPAYREDPPDEPTPKNSAVMPYITQVQRNKIFAKARACQIADEDLKAFISVVIGREIESTKEIYVKEASRILDVLENAETTESYKKKAGIVENPAIIPLSEIPMTVKDTDGLFK